MKSLIYGKAIFDQERYIRDKNSIIHVANFNYIQTDLDDGIYFWLNDYLEVQNIADIKFGCIINVTNGTISWPLKYNGLNDNLLSIFHNNIEDSELSIIVTEFRKQYNLITEIFWIKEYFLLSKILERQLNYYIHKLLKFKDEFLIQLYISIIHYLNGDINSAKSNINKCIATISNLNLVRFTEYLLKLKGEYKNETRYFVFDYYILTKTDKALNDDDNKDPKLYTFKLKKTIENISKKNVIRINGNKTSVISQLNQYKPKLLILCGHGNPNYGYLISDGKNDSIYPEYLDQNDITQLLDKYRGDDQLLMLDFVCSKGYYSHGNYLRKVNYLSNDKYGEGTFNDPSAYFYSIGFFRKFNGLNSIERSHNWGLLSLSIFNDEFLNTYNLRLINP